MESGKMNLRDTSKSLVLFSCIVILFIGCKVNVPSKSLEHKYLYLETLLASYQNIYFKDPENIQDLLHFFCWKEISNDKTLRVTIAEFKRDVNSMNLRVNNGYVEILSDDLVLCSMPSHSFELASWGNINTAYLKISAFDHNNYPVEEKTNKIILQGLREIQKCYEKRELLFPDDNGGDYVIIEYIAKDKKLVIKNPGDFAYLLEYDYFKEMVKYFEMICGKYNLTRIVWATHLCYNLADIELNYKGRVC